MKTQHIVVALILAALSAHSASAANTVTFDNQANKPALVKLVGPTATSVSVATGAKESVDVAAGHYFIKVRYGTPGQYSYSKGDEFDVTETATSSSKITITLHRVLNGNYGSREIGEKEFGKEDAPERPDAEKKQSAAGLSVVKARALPFYLYGGIQPPPMNYAPDGKSLFAVHLRTTNSFRELRAQDFVLKTSDKSTFKGNAVNLTPTAADVYFYTDEKPIAYVGQQKEPKEFAVLFTIPKNSKPVSIHWGDTEAAIPPELQKGSDK